MAVPYRILVIYMFVVVCLCPGPSWSQTARLRKTDLVTSVFNTTVVDGDPSICSFEGTTELATFQPPYFYRYLQPLSGYLYVGAMNCLLRLSQLDLSHVDSRTFPVDGHDLWKCTLQGKAEKPDCQNHIRAVLPDVNDNSKLFVCGTGGYAPTRYSLNDGTLNHSDPSVDGTKYCPFDPFDNITSIHVPYGNLENRSAHYFGLFGDFIKHFPVFYRPSFNTTAYPDLVTAGGDVTWLNAPQFVGSFEINDADKGNQVFFFFREIAEEYTASKTKIFSRVAKVCKKDQGGGTTGRSKKWLSYQKARLNCSLPGFEPYYWDDIYDVYEVNDKFYALFFKQGGDHNSSAICVYSKVDVFQVFAGRFKKRGDDKTWETVPEAAEPDPRLDNCYLHDTNPSLFSDPQTVLKYQLMEENVNSLYGKPIYTKSGIQFLKIVVNADGNNGGSNIYLATDAGEIYNLFLYECADKDFLLEETTILYPLEDQRPIWNMKFMDDQHSLFLSTDYEVVKMSLDLCSKHKKKDSCILDIHCYWCNDTYDKTCRPRTDNSCQDKITYSSVYSTENEMCSVEDISSVLDEPVSTIRANPMKGLYVTLDVNYGLQRTGAVSWEKDNQTISFDDNDHFFLSNDGSLIIRNVSESDRGLFKAYDTVYRKFKKVAEYNVTVNPGQSPDDLIEAWKQAFIDWSTSYRSWESCTRDFLKDQCSQP